MWVVDRFVVWLFLRCDRAGHYLGHVGGRVPVARFKLVRLGGDFVEDTPPPRRRHRRDTYFLALVRQRHDGAVTFVRQHHILRRHLVLADARIFSEDRI